jgi:hypothetical protein
MNEHDDDLESTVHEGAEEETDTFPDTADELNGARDESENDESENEAEEPHLDEDEAEL